MIRLLVAFVACMLMASSAMAQRQCDKVTTFAYTTATGPVEIVPGQPGLQIYYCGFALANRGPTLTIKVWGGTVGTCAVVEDFGPAWEFPNDLAIVNRVETVGPHTGPSESICLQTSGTGSLTGAIYWAQF